MLPTTSHTISNLTENVPISAQEAGVWTKLMKKTIQAKIKMTKFTMTVLTLKKLYSKSLGTDCVEKFVQNKNFHVYIFLAALAALYLTLVSHSLTD